MPTATTKRAPIPILAPELAHWARALAAVLRLPEHDPRLADDAWVAAALGADGVTDPAEAWNSLVAHGLLPEGALDDPGRRFLAPECPPCSAFQHPSRKRFTHPRWCDGCGGTRRNASAVPVTVADAVSLAANWPGVLAAEEIALTYQREVCGYENGSRYWSRLSAQEADRLQARFGSGRGDPDTAMTRLLEAIDERGYALNSIFPGGLVLSFALPHALAPRRPPKRAPARSPVSAASTPRDRSR